MGFALLASFVIFIIPLGFPFRKGLFISLRFGANPYSIDLSRASWARALSLQGIECRPLPFDPLRLMHQSHLGYQVQML